MTTPTLNQFIPSAEFLQTGLIVGSPCWELWLPTEVVVTEPQIVTPQVARVYRTRYLLADGVLMSFDDAQRTIEGYCGCSYYPRVYLWEVWRERGGDGHVRFELCGFIFLSGETHPLPEDRQYPRMLEDWYWDWRREETDETH